MRNVGKILTSLSVLLISFNFSYAQGWRGITPLHSTREDVERLIGPPMEPRGEIYDLEDERINIAYSSGTCDPRYPYGWNVPPGTVIGIEVHPKKKLPIAALQLDLSKYKKSEPGGIPGVVYYSDETGIHVETTYSREDVESIQYVPAARDSHLRCPAAVAQQAEIDRGESATYFPDQYYYDVSPKQERIILEIFAEKLERHPPQSKVYIIGYADQCAVVNEALTRANHAKNILVNKLGVPEQRVTTIDGGHRDDVRIQLYIVPPGKPKPLAVPTIHPKNVRIIKGNSPRNDSCREKQKSVQ
jgi:hypothetical protein